MIEKLINPGNCASDFGTQIPLYFIQAVKTEVPTMYRETKNILLAALISAPLFANAAPPPAAAAVPAEAKSIEAKGFQNPDDAAKALLEAVSGEGTDQLIALFGSDEAELLSSGDEVEDKNNRLNFVALGQEKMGIELIGEDKAIIHLGNTDWPFPIPIVKKGDNWLFDAEQGRQEILNRRIGRNELSTIGAIKGYIEAQFEYANADRDDDDVSEYAQKLHSEPGKFDGLFWEVEEGQPQSPLGPLIAEARAVGYKAKSGAEKPSPYHGYYYRILTRQGRNAPGGKYDYIINKNMIAGFGLVAFPAQYGSSGIMTFVVNHQGKIYQKDLGPKTAAIVEKINEYNPDSTWEAFQAAE
ncbi:DUF2950 domain-containing protein [Methylicorpusculum oleiharenae]|uniref:DUF2950 domain-containing protein n=1 Tax=Methylicorpusculum oleiharenae TaxID=1338687 RepID=UPI00135B2FD1|nr:DUF2950 domain-containing protein [Methylicorpusculum oleiharenae]MCD2452282.1 DUF2950 domain-containing protein [Methylicorpusculum oleiharenae]